MPPGREKVIYLLAALCEWFPPNGKLALASLSTLLHALGRQLPVHHVHLGVNPHCKPGKESLLDKLNTFISAYISEIST